jgi:hypothetical protein
MFTYILLFVSLNAKSKCVLHLSFGNRIKNVRNTRLPEGSNYLKISMFLEERAGGLAVREASIEENRCCYYSQYICNSL